MSKFSFDVLQRRVFPFTKNMGGEVVLGAAFGEDVALTRIGGDILASHVDPIVGAVGNIGRLAVHVSCNDIAASGIPPRWLLLLVLVPSRDQEELLEEIMRDASRAAGEVNAAIIGGHTGYSAGLSRPLVAVTAMGAASGRKPVRTGGARPGDSVLVTKGIGLEGTAILAEDFADVALSLGLTERDLKSAGELIGSISVMPEALILAESGASSMHDVTRGGLLETLLEISYVSGVMIEIDSSLLPVPETVSRFADAFDFDPLQMISSGTLAVTVPKTRLADTKKALDESGTVFAEVGRVKKGAGVTISRKGRPEHYSELQAERDELARLWRLYPRDS